MAFLDTPYHIEREHADLYVEQVGPEEGEPIYFLHGGPGYSSFSFRELLGDELEKYRMIYADQRGGGRSYADADYTLDDLADDVGAVLDALGVPRVTFLAHGFGALIASRVAVKLPDRVERLIFVNPWFSMPLLARALNREAAMVVGNSDTLLPPEEGLADPQSLDPQQLIDEAFEQVAAKHLFDLMQFPDPSSRLRLEHSDATALFGPSELAMPAEPWRLDVTEELGSLRQPTVVLAGKEDRSSYPEQVEAGLERLQHALFSLLPGGHYPWIDAPDDFLGLLNEVMMP